MTVDGPIIHVLIGVSTPRYQALRAAKQPQPQPITVPMLVDTGSSGCCVNQGLLAPLGLVPTGSIPMHTPTTGGAPVACDQYDISMMIPHPQTPFFVPIIAVIECRPLPGAIKGLIGRDFLSRCLFLYQGQLQGFSLAF